MLEAYEAHEAYEVQFHAAYPESGTLRSLILALGRFALENGGLPWAAAQTCLGTSPQTPSSLRGGLKMLFKKSSPLRGGFNPQTKKSPPSYRAAIA